MVLVGPAVIFERIVLVPIRLVYQEDDRQLLHDDLLDGVHRLLLLAQAGRAVVLVEQGVGAGVRPALEVARGGLANRLCAVAAQHRLIDIVGAWSRGLIPDRHLEVAALHVLLDRAWLAIDHLHLDPDALEVVGDDLVISFPVGIPRDATNGERQLLAVGAGHNAVRSLFVAGTRQRLLGLGEILLIGEVGIGGVEELFVGGQNQASGVCDRLLAALTALVGLVAVVGEADR